MEVILVSGWFLPPVTPPTPLGGTTMYGLTVALALSLTGQLQILGKPSDKPDVKYDKFDDVTVISTNLGKIPGDDGRNLGSC